MDQGPGHRDESRTADTDADHTVWHAWDQSTPPCVSVVKAVAAATGRTVADLPPLQRSVDVDSLHALLTGEQSDSVTASFRYADTDVRVQGNGIVQVRVDGRTTPEDGD